MKSSSYFNDEGYKFNVYITDLKTRRAVERNIEIIGEAINRILKKDPNFKIENSQQIIGTRNRIIHGYDKISDELIWSIIINRPNCKLYQILVTLTKIETIMGRNTSISIGSYFDNFIQNKISAGRFKNASEVVRAGLRLLEEEENRAVALNSAIQEGIESGIAKDFNPETHLSKLKSKKKLNGKN